MSIVVGIGCRTGVPSAAFVALVERALAGRTAAALATPAFKATDPGLLGAARTLDLPVWPIDDAALGHAQARSTTHSAAARAAIGFGSVAEAAALATHPAARLVLARITDGRVTVALAELP